MLVFSCGTRPNVQLAAAAGLATCRGVVVDDALRSITDPRILAIGDCAEHRGQVYGLALPALEQAAVAAATVAHGGPPVPYAGSRPVIRLKADGIDLAAMGDSCDDPHDTGHDAAEVVKFVDPVRGTYKKLVIRNGRWLARSCSVTSARWARSRSPTTGRLPCRPTGSICSSADRANGGRTATL